MAARNLTYEQASALSDAEKFELLCGALAFASNTAPYALTDAEHDVLSEFVQPLDPDA